MGDLIEGPYLRDVLEQPQALERTLAKLEERRDLRALGALLGGGQFRRVVLTGMGASYHALHPLALSLAARGFTPVHLETSELIHHAPAMLDGGSLLVVVSQSGRSAEIVKLVEMAEGRATIVGVTNEAGSPLASKSAHVLLTQAGPEATVSCKTYVSALAALGWLSAHMTGSDVAQARASLQLVPAALTKLLSSVKDQATKLAGELKEIEHVFLVGRGASIASAGTGGLIIKEAAKVHAEGLSAAAFRHGPLEMLGPKTFVLAYEGVAPTQPLITRLVEDIRKAGGRAALVGPGAPAGPFRLPAEPAIGRQIFEIVSAQLLSLALAAARGIEAGAFKHARKVTDSE